MSEGCIEIAEGLRYYSQMLKIRRFEEKIDWLFARDMIGGTCHLCIGQEAVAVGAMAALNENDYAVSHHRGHGHLLAKGADPKRLMSEIMGKKAGYCGGKGGTQHLCVMEKSFLGTNSITGGGIPLATGAALSVKLRKTDQVVICFFGDGATNQGTFHESLNMAAIWQLPVIYICENNLYAMSTPYRDTMAVKDISTRAASFGMVGIQVDGMDLLSIKKTVEQSAYQAREGTGPTFIEAMTYRYCGHSKSDVRKYRTRDEENQWQKKDPLLLWEKQLLTNGISETQLDQIHKQIELEIEEASDFAMNDSFPDTSDAFNGVFA